MKIKIVKVGVISEDGDHLERVVFSNGDIQWKNKSKCEDIDGEEARQVEKTYREKAMSETGTFNLGKYLVP